jgi:hypothetical protein
MAGNFLSARSWAVFLGCEFILAGCLIVLGAFSGAALIVVGAVLLCSLWAWDNRRPLVRSALARVGVPSRWLPRTNDGRFMEPAPQPDVPFVEATKYLNNHPTFGPGRHAKTTLGLLMAHPEAARMLENAAKSGKIAVWGAVEIHRSRDPSSGEEIHEFADALELIPQIHWATHFLEDRIVDGHVKSDEHSNLLHARRPI